MHIPDGFLDPKVWVIADLIGLGYLTQAIRKTRKVLENSQIPLLAVMAAFIFAAQMINFPVAGGTSGHLLGGALAAILLGPWNAGLIMTVVLIIQCLFFYDGGITALGANVLNMAVIAPWVAYGVYQGITRLFKGKRGQGGRFGAIFSASWLSVMAAAIACTMEIVLAGAVPLKIALPAMTGWHALIGIGEGIITAAVVAVVSPVWEMKAGEKRA